ncbi:MAG: TlpA family protein disulfide reductase [Candidatus Omnitrophica bacterium]|nr:TlpA family protein disulfide reductase [Candidatus Omnitrophota bacterium]
MKKIAWGILAAALLAGATLLLTRPGPSGSAPRGLETGGESPVRSPAADFQLTDLAGKPVSLSASRGKVVILDFWATWCPPCREEIPHFKALYAKYKTKGVEIIGVALDRGGLAVVKPFAASAGINYPVVLGTREVVRAYGGVRGIPTTFVIDRQGGIVRKYVGYQPPEVFERDVKNLLAE